MILSEDAKEYVTKLFPCEKPCDSYGICEGCYELRIFEAGYSMGLKAATMKCMSYKDTLNSSLKYGTPEEIAKAESAFNCAVLIHCLLEEDAEENK